MNNNDEDWKKIDEWNEDRKREEKIKFGLNFEDIQINEKHKGVNTINKGLKIMGKTLKITEIFIIMIVIIIVFFIFYYIIENINSKTNVKPKATIENRYNTKIELISKEVDEKENGIYFFRVSNNKSIQFTAIKKFGNLREDYLDNCHKYYFEKWMYNEKNNFAIIEDKEEDILYYATYININTYEELENGMKNINDFVDFCGENFNTAWRVYLKMGEYIIYPYQQSDVNKDEAEKTVKSIYENILKSKN